MLGERIEDEVGIDIKDGKAMCALGILPVETRFVSDKKVRLVRADLLSQAFGSGAEKVMKFIWDGQR